MGLKIPPWKLQKIKNKTYFKKPLLLKLTRISHPFAMFITPFLLCYFSEMSLFLQMELVRGYRAQQQQNPFVNERTTKQNLEEINWTFPGMTKHRL